MRPGLPDVQVLNRASGHPGSHEGGRAGERRVHRPTPTGIRMLCAKSEQLADKPGYFVKKIGNAETRVNSRQLVIG